MKKIFSYILAAVCAAAAFSCNFAPEVEIDDPNLERDVVLTAAFSEPDTRGVSVTGDAITATWTVGDWLYLAYGGKVVSTLQVTAVTGNKATVTGTVKGAYPVNTAFMLFYSTTNHNYAGQNGTAASAAQRAYLLADNVKIVSQTDKTLSLGTVVMQYQQAFGELQFRFGPDLIPVKKLEITGSSKIVSSRTLTDNGWMTSYFAGTSDDHFVVNANGATTVFFAISDEAAGNVDYSFLVYDTDNHPYTAHVKEGTHFTNGTYVSGEWVLDQMPPTVTPPSPTTIVYDGEAHDLVTAGQVRHGLRPTEEALGASMWYLVSTADPTDPTNEPADDATGWSLDVPQGIEPGTYYVWYKVDGGEYFTSSKGYVTVVIDKRATTTTAPTGISGLKFTGSTQVLVNAGSVADATDPSLFTPDLVMKYLVTATDTAPALDAAEWSADIPYGTNAGTYYIWYKVDGNDHYYGYDDATTAHTQLVGGPVSVSIAKADAVLANPVPIENLVYNGAPQQLVLPADASDGCTVYYYVTTNPETERDVVVALDDASWTTEVAKQTNAGTYYIWTKIVEAEGNSNYTGIPDGGVSVAALVATIAKAPVTATAPTLTTASLVYNGSVQQLVSAAGTLTYASATSPTADATVNPPEEFPAKMQYAVTAGSVTTAPAEGWVDDFTQITGLNAGTYKVWYKGVGSANFKDVAPASAGTVTIAKATVTVSDISVVSGFTYDASEHNLVSGTPSITYASASGTAAATGGTLSYAITTTNSAPSSGWSTDVPKRTNAGTYFVWYMVDFPDNSNFADYAATQLGSVAIAKADPTLTSAPTPNTSLTYVASAQQLISAGATYSPNTLPVSYQVTNSTTNPDPDAGTWVNDISEVTGTNAGTYYIWTKVTGNANYNTVVFDGYATASIAKATGSVSLDVTSLSFLSTDDVNSTKSINVTGSNGPLGYSISIANPEDADKISVSGSAPTFTVTRNSALATVGDITVTISVTDEDNYTPASADVTVTMAALPPLAAVTTDDIGKFIGTNGNIYDSPSSAGGVALVAMIAYVGSDSDCAHGLAISLADYGAGYWSNIVQSDWLSTKSIVNAPTGSAWRVPSWGDVVKMYEASYSSPTSLNDRLSSGSPSYEFTTVSGNKTWYWTSSVDEPNATIFRDQDSNAPDWGLNSTSEAVNTFRYVFSF